MNDEQGNTYRLDAAEISGTPAADVTACSSKSANPTRALFANTFRFQNQEFKTTNRKFTTESRNPFRFSSGLFVFTLFSMAPGLHDFSRLSAADHLAHHDSWIVYFSDAVFTGVRADLESAVGARLVEENPIA